MSLKNIFSSNNTGDAVKHPGSLTIDKSTLGGSLSSNDYAQYGQSAMDALRRAQDHAAMQAMYAPQHIFTTANRYDVSREDARKLMIAMRLRLDEGSEWPFQHISTALANDKVFVFVVQNNKPVTLEDDASLFPSDTLVSQLTLLK